MFQQGLHRLIGCRNSISKKKDDQVIRVPVMNLSRARKCKVEARRGADQGFAASAQVFPQPMPRLSHRHWYRADSSTTSRGNQDTQSWQWETISTSSKSKMGGLSANRAALSYLWQNNEEKWEDLLTWTGSANCYLENSFSFRSSNTLQRICPVKELKTHSRHCPSNCPSTCSTFPPSHNSLLRKFEPSATTQGL